MYLQVLHLQRFSKVTLKQFTELNINNKKEKFGHFLYIMSVFLVQEKSIAFSYITPSPPCPKKDMHLVFLGKEYMKEKKIFSKASTA